MKYQSNDIEILNIRKEILVELFNDLESISSKISTNSKAYRELNILVDSMNLKINDVNNQINKHFDADKEEYSNLRIKIKSLKELIILKNEFGRNSIAELLDVLLHNYKDLLSIKNLIEFTPLKLKKEQQFMLNKTDIYASSSKSSDRIIIHKLDDIIVYDDKEYLDIEKFKEFTIYTKNFLISPNFTLKDLDKFKLIWK